MAARRMRFRPGVLSPRQREVARLVGQGLTNRQIAEHLDISVRTVDTHVWGTMTRLNVNRRAEIVRLVATAAAFGISVGELFQSVVV